MGSITPTPHDLLPSITLHDRTYLLPRQPTVIVCVDGFDPTYLTQGIDDGILPNLSKFVTSGFHAPARCAMPSLTNPNNCSIITGVPTAVHGIAGNFYLDKKTGEEHMILDDALLRGDTILQLMHERGVRVAAITAKDKLRKIINHGLFPSAGKEKGGKAGGGGAICFSAQNANTCTQAANGISDVESWLGQPTPSQYSGELSLFVLDAGIKLLEEDRADLFYLTLSDFIQHKHTPGSSVSDDFLSKLDAKLGRLVELGAVVAVTGDHGMSDKSKDDGEPDILFLEDELVKRWEAARPRVICPIADPFVRHHGALGGFVRVHLLGLASAPAEEVEKVVKEMIEFCNSLPQVEVALSGLEAAERFEMPGDREGDLVVVSRKNAVVGAREGEHDLEALKGHRLRSHGGLSEQGVPVIRSAPLGAEDLKAVEGRDWRNFDVFDLALNY